MKKKSFNKNYGLRVAGLLLLACVLIMNATTGIVARYSENAAFTNQYVRVAAFSFVVTDKPYNGNGGWSATQKDIVKAGSSTFSLALFDYEYKNPANTVSTVLGKDKALVIAPGTGHGSGGGHLANIPGDPPYDFIPIKIQNRSEVPVRFRIVVDSVTMPSNLILMTRAPSVDDYGNASTFTDPYFNQYGNPAKFAAGVYGTNWTFPAANTIFYDWYYLPPDSQEVTRWFTWWVKFDLNVHDTTMTGSDNADTTLGKAVAAALKTGGDLTPFEVNLKFRIEVEQLD